MILANLTRAIRQQNWFAVTVEFLIVIAGVVIGFQIQGWTQSRETFALEQQLIQQLEADLTSLEQQREGNAEVYARRLETLDLVQLKIHSDLETSVLSDQECMAIVYSRNNPSYTYEIPALDELISSTGRASISDTELNSAITKFIQEREQVLFTNQRMAQRLLPLDVRHPELLVRSYIHQDTQPDQPPSRQSNPFTIHCDLAGMRSNTGFKNDLIFNHETLQAFHVIVLQEMEKVIGDLRAAVDTYNGARS